MRYMVELTDEVQIELDVTAGAPPLTGMTLEWVARDGAHLRELLVELGGGLEAWALSSDTGCAYRFGVPITKDGEKTGAAMVVVRLPRDRQRQPQPLYREITELIAERDAAKAAV